MEVKPLLWAAHRRCIIPVKQYNLTTALRNASSSVLQLDILFALAILGVDPIL